MQNLIKKFLDRNSKLPEETVKEIERKFVNMGLIFKEIKKLGNIYVSKYKIGDRDKAIGKGITEILAKLDALFALVKKFSTSTFYEEIKNRAIFSTFEELKEKAIPLEKLLISVENDEPAEIKNIGLKYLRKIPFYFIPFFEIYTQKEKFIPFHWFWLLYEDSSSAAGNTYSEASIKAICNLIKRHADTMFVRKNIPLPTIKKEFSDKEIDSILKYYEDLNFKIWIKDLTFEMPVPTVATIAVGTSTSSEKAKIIYTSKTATSPQEALKEALIEIAQFIDEFDKEEMDFPKFKNFENVRNIILSFEEVNLETLPDLSSDDPLEELMNLAEKLHKKGYDIYLSDLTSSHLDIPVVYAVIPGLLSQEKTKISFLYHLARTLSLYMSPQDFKNILEEMVKEIDNKYYLWAYLGNAYKQLDKKLEAIFCYEKALQLSPPSSDGIAIISHLADIFLKSGEYKKAIEIAERALTIGETPEIYNILGRAYYKMGDYFKAMSAFFKATELDPFSAIDYANIGYCLKALNYLPAALIYFKKALQLNPKLTMAERGLQYCENVLNIRN